MSAGASVGRRSSQGEGIPLRGQVLPVRARALARLSPCTEVRWTAGASRPVRAAIPDVVRTELNDTPVTGSTRVWRSVRILAMQLSLLPEAIHLIRIDPPLNMQRYYRMRLAPDLFGGCALVREWGRIGLSCRREIELHADEGTAQDRLLAIARHKHRRGYVSSDL